MATTNMDDTLPLADDVQSKSNSSKSLWVDYVKPVASLKISVYSFAVAIFLILAGTLAQAEKDIWEVLHQYFRCWFAWVEIRVFFPPAWFPEISRESISIGLGNARLTGFWIPGGWTIGTVMAVNLLAAHSLRFKIQAKGAKLTSGLGITLAGIVLTLLVIVGGGDQASSANSGSLSPGVIWTSFNLSLLLISVSTLFWASSISKEKVIEFRLLFATALALGMIAVFLLAQGNAYRLDDSGMRILWQLLKATFAGIVLLVGCYQLFNKRAGIVLLHAGILLMMSNEIVVAMLHKETQMRLIEGEYKNYVDDIRTYELAFFDEKHPDGTKEIVIPKQLLIPGKIIDDERLPVKIKITHAFNNSMTVDKGTESAVSGDMGIANELALQQIPSVTGAESGGKVNLPGIVAELTPRDNPDNTGTFVFPVVLGMQDIFDEITVEKKTWKVGLRFERTYKDYTIMLTDVRKDNYAGTDIEKNYSSDIRLVDPSHNEDGEHHIWMNNPLRYSGETFYQSGYFKDPQTGEESTTLQIVTNEGWMIPYVACMIVTVGMFYQFILTLVRFLNKKIRTAGLAVSSQSSEGAHVGTPAQAVSSIQWKSIVASLLIAALPCLYLVSKARPAKVKPNEFNLVKYGQIPVLYEGRVKPLDTLARNSLRILSNWETYPVIVPEEEVKSYQKILAFLSGRSEVTRREPAIKWLADIIMSPVRSRAINVIRIDDPELHDLLGLKKRQNHLYSIKDLLPKYPELVEASKKAHELKIAKRPLTHRQKKVLELENKIGILNVLYKTFGTPDFEANPENVVAELANVAQDCVRLQTTNPPLIIPGEIDEEKWISYYQALTMEFVRPMSEVKQYRPIQQMLLSSISGMGQDNKTPFPTEKNNLTVLFTKMSEIYDSVDEPTDEQITKFEENLDAYLKEIAETSPKLAKLKELKFETSYNQFSPSFYAGVVYLWAFILTAISWLIFPRTINRAVMWIMLFTFLIHTYAIVARIMISGRPPVTNLYSSAVFIGWGGVLTALVIEFAYRRGIGNIIGTISGFVTMWIAFGLSGEGETMKVLQAVLDTQFWLSTHVVCVSLGYTATYVAGLLGIIYVLRGLCTWTLKKDDAKEISRMLYGTLCFALFFSFVGTVLGGLWADDSWGRFWGWDPKENGALIIVLWNALVLHARWDGMVKERGMALLAIGGNLATSWSWFGVNQLGIGLHTYGFTEGVLATLFYFALFHLVIIGMGLIPVKYWLSSRYLAEK